MSTPPEYRAHQEWLGYVQPVGLVVSIPALLNAEAYVQRNVAADHQRFLALLPRDGDGQIVPQIPDFRVFAQEILGWESADLVAPPDSLSVPLPTYGETLTPTFAVPDSKAKDETKPWLMLVQCVPAGTDLDANGLDQQQWTASPHSKLELLLLKTGVPIGVLFNHRELRLIYKPAGESSGHVTFSVSNMAEVSGRPIFAALQMLLSASRLFYGEEKKRLPAILAESRKYQNVVSTQLAEQVLAALYELVHGLQAADAQKNGELLKDVLAEDPNQVYAGLLTVLLRLVFVLYAEDRDLLSRDDVYNRFYSITGLFARLREDAGRFHDTMEQRYGAWAQLLVLFRLVYDGARHGKFQLPAREGYLFDPDRYPFLEGRPLRSKRESFERLAVPHVSDGVVYRVLQNLLILDGERLSYRSLDVEHIGGVYETMMGFSLQVAQGRSIAIKPTKSHGAPTTINLDELLTQKAADRAKWLKEQTDQNFTGQAADALKGAQTIEDLLVGLDKKIARSATASIVPLGAMVLQPSDERRKSGSHYTPRSLTEPIVRTTLRPILERLGEDRTPDQILDLKVCDPAMGSGAFLVEACRQLGDQLVEAWHRHRCVPALPPDEDEILHARRLVAQRCLYGVDKNPLAVDLSKLSLWLATLAKDHPFTFLDHSLRAGDSLVGLTRRQIENFTWEQDNGDEGHEIKGKKKVKGEAATAYLFADPLKAKLRRVLDLRQKLLAAPENESYRLMKQRLAGIEEAMETIRLTGDLVIAAFFSSDKDKQRKEALDTAGRKLTLYFGPPPKPELIVELQVLVHGLRTDPRPIEPFHWQIEFPEVFERENGGFDAIVGNPPFLGGPNMGGRLGLSYHEYLVCVFETTTGLTDLVAFFFRQAFCLIRSVGTFGLIAKNTILQGDSRSSGLQFLLANGGWIYEAVRRHQWGGVAAVNVCIVWLSKRTQKRKPVLDGVPVARISAFLLNGHTDGMPFQLIANKGKCFQGTKIWGSGFLFEPNPGGGSSSLADMEFILARDPKSRDVIFPYIGGEEFNTSPTLEPFRFVIDFGAMAEGEARRWPLLFEIIEERVRPVRASNKQRNYRENWWLHANRVEEAAPFVARHGRLLALSAASKHLALGFVSAGTIAANSLIVILFHNEGAFAVLQSQVHEVWVRLLGSTLEDRLRYTTPCFDTFPMPTGYRSGEALDAVGKRYYEFRARMMQRNEEGLTETYNRFHDPDHDRAESEPEIVVAIQHLRELHTAMDRAILEAYGWQDLANRANCEFLLDYDEETENEESESRGRRNRKRPWRYRWPEDFRDEVLARLLELNKERAQQERLEGESAEAKTAKSKGGQGIKPPKPRKRKPAAAEAEPALLPQKLSREHHLILLAMGIWGKRWQSRRTVDCALILAFDDRLRTAFLKGTKFNRGKNPDFNKLLTELSIDGLIEQLPNPQYQQMWRITDEAPPTDVMTAEDAQRITEVKECFARAEQSGNVTLSQDTVDAELDLVSERN